MENILKEIKYPGKEYRPVPFWSWNDKLDTETLKWQVKEMSEAGLGGCFMHARGGLETEYLGQEWMNCISECIKEGNKTGMHSWIYDENGWPSGFADGAVTALGDRYHGRWLKIQSYSSKNLIVETSDILGVYKIDRESNTAVKINILQADTSEEIVTIRNCSNPYYIDVMSREAVRAFIDSTHEKYYSLFKEEFGKGLKGFFTDEPRLSGDFEGDIPWSYAIPEEFKRLYGYDILEVLPSLFIKFAGYEKVRYDFWNLVSKLFVNSFIKQIGDWCREHNCMLTGHIMMEESIFTQMTGTAGVMPFYEHMDIPGIDWLRRMISSPVVPKQVGSVATQLGKKHVLTESFALCGWNVDFEELKWIVEWQFVNGVNLVCQHLQGYTIRGLRKRDYPPSLFIQQSWWKDYHLFNDYLAKLSLLLSSGKSNVNALLLHPMKSGWVVYDGNNNDEIKKLDTDFIQASELLSDLHIDYHYGDETIIEKYGRVEESNFVIGNCKYKVVFLPSMVTIDENTLNLLSEFAQKGGKIISLGEVPRLCGGKESDKLKTLKNSLITVWNNKSLLYSLVANYSITSISIKANNTEIEDIHYHERGLGERRLFFLVNHSQEKAYDASVRLKSKAKVKKLSLESDELIDLLCSETEDGVEIKLHFAPMQSHVLITEKVDDKYVLTDVKTESSEKVVTPDTTWNIEDMGLNSLTLDYCSYSIDNGPWEEDIPVIHLMDKLLNLRRSCAIALRFNFNTDMDLSKNNALYLAMEMPEKFKIYVNDQEVESSAMGWWKDTSFKKVDIKPYVKNGANEIVLKGEFYQSPKVYEVLFGESVYETEKNKLTYDIELESVYIVGDFGVRSLGSYSCGDREAIFTEGPFIIVDKPIAVHTGDLTTQGLCFFSDTIKLSQVLNIEKSQGERLVLDMGKPEAEITKVFINDKLVKSLLWAPYTVDITDYVVQGKNKLTLEFYASNRNLLGPHHHIDGEVFNVGPLSFTGRWSWVEKKSEAIPSTKEDREKSYWTDRYSFVRFGLK
jgi:hypothetical protein